MGPSPYHAVNMAHPFISFSQSAFPEKLLRPFSKKINSFGMVAWSTGEFEGTERI